MIFLLHESYNWSMIIKKYNYIAEIEHVWKDLYANNNELSFYQSYEWYRILEHNFVGKRLTKYRNHKLVYYVIDECVILPLVISKSERKLSILGEEEANDYLSIVFRKLDYPFFLSMMKAIAEDNPGYQISFDKINQYSSLLPFFIEMCKERKTVLTEEKKECVCIDTAIVTNSYYESLSKSVKQNYRTAKNRLSKDGLLYEVTTLITTVDKKLGDELYNIYIERRRDCDKRNNAVQLVANAKKTFFHTFGIENSVDPLTEYSMVSPVFLSILRINGRIAAFCEGGLNNRNDSISIARVATSGDFYHYSPGQILLIETIESVRQRIRYFDLTRGKEDYKIKLGGQIHYNYKFTIEEIKL